jgi:hypothetical protein
MVLSSVESLPIQALQLMQKERENSGSYEKSYHPSFPSDTSTSVLLASRRGGEEIHLRKASIHKCSALVLSL